MPFVSTDNASDVDNQQETRQSMFYKRSFYYTGFCSGEMSCSLLRLSNRRSKNGGVYYSPDITIANADLILLKNINRVLGNRGVISTIKGGYNLSFRGKEKVRKVFAFLKKYPPITGDLTLSRLTLLRKALIILEARKGYRRSLLDQRRLDGIRQQLFILKKTAVPTQSFSQKTFDRDSIGYFLAGVLDAEGSVGIKKNGVKHTQPFFAVAMRDRKIVELFHSFLNVGHIHLRPKEKMFHFEIGSRKEVLQVVQMFLRIYPSKLLKMKKRLKRLLRILNDYTPRLPNGR